MPGTTMLHVRVDEDVKEKAAEALALMGLSVSEAVRVFLKRVAVEQAIPFEVRVPNAATQAALEEGRSIAKARFADTDSLFGGLAEAAG